MDIQSLQESLGEDFTKFPTVISRHYFNRYLNLISYYKEEDTLSRSEVSEKHHIVPKSYGGSDNETNLVLLPLRVHFIAHWMLWKSFRESKMARAFSMMRNKGEIKNSKIYENLRRDFYGSFEDISGRSFGYWTAIRPIFTTNKHGLHYLCQCKCRTIKHVKYFHLIKGLSKSCGCLKIENIQNRAPHGKTETTEHKIYQRLRSICLSQVSKESKKNPNASMCDRWSQPKGAGFLNFLHDMGPRPSNNHTLVVIDNTKEYGPDNCIWTEYPKLFNNDTLRGVYWSKAYKHWLVKMFINKETVHIISTPDFFEACCARKSAESRYRRIEIEKYKLLRQG